MPARRSARRAWARSAPVEAPDVQLLLADDGGQPAALAALSPSPGTTQAFQSVILRMRNPSAPPTSRISTIKEPVIASSTVAGSGVIMRMRLNPAITGSGIHPSASIFERRKTSFTRFSTEK